MEILIQVGLVIGSVLLILLSIAISLPLIIIMSALGIIVLVLDLLFSGYKGYLILGGTIAFILIKLLMSSS